MQFKRILNEHPQSRFRPDAWMAVAEARFYDDNDYKGALAGYDEVLKFPDSPLYDLALFKTAWCYWKLGDSDRAARRFKEVLDLGSGVTAKSQARAHQLTEAGRKRLEELKGEALEYLVQVFTEDEKKGPKDAFDFLASIGGAIYSRKVIAQAGRHVLCAGALRSRRSSRSASSSSSIPTTRATPIAQKRIVEALREMDENKEADQGAAQARRDLRARQRLGQGAAEPAGGRARAQARGRHAARSGQGAARRRAAQRAAAKGHIDVDRYARAADAYAYYLSHFGNDTDAVEVHYLLGDIYFFKLKKYEEAGDQYLAVGKSKPVGKLHREALLQAIASLRKAAARSLRRRQEGALADGQAHGRGDRSLRHARSRTIRRSPTSSIKTGSSSMTTANMTKR